MADNVIQQITAPMKLQMGAEERARIQLDVMRYIDFLAATTGTNISDWNLKTIFKNKTKGAGGDLVSEKETINRLFYLHREKLKAKAATEPLPELPLPAGFEKIDENRKKAATSLNDQNIKQWESTLASYQKYVTDAEANIKKLREEAERIAQNQTPVLDEIKKVMAAKWWTNPAIDGNYLWLMTPGDVICTVDTDRYAQYNAPRGHKVNFGKMSVRVDLSNFACCVFPEGNNVFLKEYVRNDQAKFYPYIIENSTVCWGNEATRYQTFAKEGKLAEILHLLSMILLKYEGDGNSHINQFTDASGNSGYHPVKDQSLRPSSWTRHPFLRAK